RIADLAHHARDVGLARAHRLEAALRPALADARDAEAPGLVRREEVREQVQPDGGGPVVGHRAALVDRVHRDALLRARAIARRAARLAGEDATASEDACRDTSSAREPPVE